MKNFKLAKIVLQLQKKVELNELSWSETEEPGVYQTSFPDSSVRIERKYVPGKRTDRYEIRFYNDEGGLIDEITHAELDDAIDDSFGTLKDIFDNARRVAMGAEETLDKILSSLEKMD